MADRSKFDVRCGSCTRGAQWAEFSRDADAHVPGLNGVAANLVADVTESHRRWTQDAVDRDMPEAELERRRERAAAAIGDAAAISAEFAVIAGAFEETLAEAAGIDCAANPIPSTRTCPRFAAATAGFAAMGEAAFGLAGRIPADPGAGR
jgi:hypothetical protein